MSVHAIYALEDLGYSRSYISSAYQWVIVCHAPDKGWWYGLCADTELEAEFARLDAQTDIQLYVGQQRIAFESEPDWFGWLVKMLAADHRLTSIHAGRQSRRILIERAHSDRNREIADQLYTTPVAAQDLAKNSDFILAVRGIRGSVACPRDLPATWRVSKEVCTKTIALVRAELKRVEDEKERQEELARNKWRVLREQHKGTYNAVLEAYKRCEYRKCSQGHEVRVTVLPSVVGQEYADPYGNVAKMDTKGKPTVRSSVIKGDQYSRRCTYRKQESVHEIEVCDDWMETVYNRGLATAGCELVLSAEYVGTHKRDGGKVVRIVTVRQGRGTSLELRKGHYLRQFGGRWVTCDEGCYHADATAEILATDSTPEGMAAYHDYQLEMAN